MGRIEFAASPAGKAEASSQAKYETPTTLSAMVRVRVDELRALANFALFPLVQLPDRSNWRIEVTRADAALQVRVADTNNGGSSNYEVPLASLPDNGNDIIIYAANGFGAGGRVIQAFTTAGESLAPAVVETGGTFAGGAGTGTIRVGGDGVTGYAISIDCVAVYDTVLTGAARYTKPLPTDAGILGLYYFAEGTGTTTADAVAGGAALALTNNTWASPGVWDAADPPPVPEADTIRIQGGGNPPWHPAAGPVLGVEYSLTLEAWDSLLGLRDTAFVGEDGTVDLATVVVLPPTIVIASGGTGTWASGLASITVTFAESSGPPFIPMEPVVQRIPVFTTQPVVAAQGSGAAFSTQPVVTVRDSNGATITGFTGLVVLRARGGMILQGNTVINAVAGVATFSGVVPILLEGTQFRGQLEAVIATGESALSDQILVLAPNQPVYQRTREATVRDYHSHGSIQIGGTVTGGPVFFEATIDGTNWVALSATPLGGGAAVTQATGPGIWRFDPNALTAVRVRLDNAVSTQPSLNIYLEAS